MSNDWNDLLKEESLEVKAARKRAAEKEEKENKYFVLKMSEFDWSILSDPWNYEKRKLYKMMGLKRLKSESKTQTYKTGELYLERTSDTTYNIKEKTGSYKNKTFFIGIEKSKITDMDKYLEILKEIDKFIGQGRKQFEYGVSPSTFNPAFRFMINWPTTLLVSAFVITIPFYLVYLIWDFYTYDSKHAESKRWIEAYNKKVKEFETEISKVVRLD